MDRRAAVRRRMEQEGVDVLIAASSGFRAFDVPDPVMFLTGFQSLGESALVLGPHERSIWLVGPWWERRPSEGLDFHAVDDVASEIAKAIGPLNPQRLATAGRGNVAP
jgi:hypothetical protein